MASSSANYKSASKKAHGSNGASRDKATDSFTHQTKYVGPIMYQPLDPFKAAAASNSRVRLDNSSNVMYGNRYQSSALSSHHGVNSQSMFRNNFSTGKAFHSDSIGGFGSNGSGSSNSDRSKYNQDHSPGASHSRHCLASFHSKTQTIRSAVPLPQLSNSFGISSAEYKPQPYKYHYTHGILPNDPPSSTKGCGSSGSSSSKYTSNQKR